MSFAERVSCLLEALSVLFLQIADFLLGEPGRRGDDFGSDTGCLHILRYLQGGVLAPFGVTFGVTLGVTLGSTFGKTFSFALWVATSMA